MTTASVPAGRSDCVGYLAVLEDERYGFTGGLLIVSLSGRPLEFHCSTPLKPTRAQEILFGATLKPHVCGELIAGSLLAAAKLRPAVVLVRDAVCGPPAAEASVVVLPPNPSDPAGQEAADPLPRCDTPETRAVLEQLAQHVSLDEPFERVTEAVREAQRLSTPEEADDLAA